jgi:Mrp family chromosome partitioning ATPase
MEEEMIVLYQSINTLLSGTQNKVIQFMGSREEEGTSTIVREFAMTTVLKYGKSVLLLDADLCNPGQHPFFNIKSEHSLEETIREGGSVDKALYQVANSSLFLGQFFKASNSPCSFLASFDIDDLLEKLKRFDFIVIDSSPATSFSIGLATSHFVNGVVLVLEAEKTRWPVTRSLKDRIISNGGKILGVVFNKQRHYIPEFIYKRL